MAQRIPIKEDVGEDDLDQEAPTPKPLSRSTSASSFTPNDGDSPDATASRTDGSSPEAAASVSSSLPRVDYPVPAALDNLFGLRSGELKVTVQQASKEGVGSDLPPGLEHLGSCGNFQAPARWKKDIPGLPNMDYPVPFDIQRGSDGLPEIDQSDSSKMAVRNTFLTVPGAGMASSECEFGKARESRSCPVSGIGCHPSSSAVNSALSSFVSTGVGQHEPDPLEDLEAYIGNWRDMNDSAADASSRILDDGLQASNDPWAAPHCFRPPVLSTSPSWSQPMVLPAPNAFPSSFTSPMLPGSMRPHHYPLPSMAMPYPLTNELRDLVPPPWAMQPSGLSEPDLASPELPSVGSAGHNTGDCKPCAFIHTKGCEGGKQCPFCHLCEPGEKKRRQKTKRAYKRTW
eukprot:TRINITY_DN103888_c0_g1_i1.p1 TRINITY_DN103888_c0_g1~~TRINITY_DN103888_c0_g1_i1.p1  ORF type:complete len:401 (+),score=46.15 TRINITY_DN103888_c0_g1_i1:55-1257(+)